MHITIKNSISEINFVHKCFTYFAKSKTENESAIQKLCIVIDEVLTNIITHGYADQGEHQIDITCEVGDDSLVLTFRDDGVPFNPLEMENLPPNKEVDSAELGGLGIHLMKNLVDQIEYERKNDMNWLVIGKNTT
ncbi:MAG: ATP-binding protein [Bacteroidia bacterium]|nr:ATP-binding protein [Bacteroidia bacterium]